MSAGTVTVRLPRAWTRLFDSAALRQWVRDYLRSPTPDLPRDPRGGEWRASFAVPKKQLKIVSGLLDESESAALRRIIAARLGALRSARTFSLPAAPQSLRASIPVSRPDASPHRPVLALCWLAAPPVAGTCL
jgi:hypothetical protein